MKGNIGGVGGRKNDHFTAIAPKPKPAPAVVKSWWLDKSREAFAVAAAERDKDGREHDPEWKRQVLKGLIVAGIGLKQQYEPGTL